ncbi:MAG: N-acetylmuramoyl-L-alanine amidase [Bacteroidota bacterium]
MRVCIDPGHGGHDSGARNGLLLEKDIVLEIGLLTAGLLRDRGVDVVLTRTRDVFLGLRERAEIANAAQADAFVSLHCNGAASPNASGVETWHYLGSGAGRELARSAYFALRDAAAGHKPRGVKAANFAVLRLTTMPAALLEYEFITNPKRGAWLARPETHLLLAQATATGVLTFMEASA